MSVQVNAAVAGAWLLTADTKKRPIVRLLICTGPDREWVTASRDDVYETAEAAREVLTATGLTRFALSEEPLLEYWIHIKDRSEDVEIMHEALLVASQVALKVYTRLRRGDGNDAVTQP